MLYLTSDVHAHFTEFQKLLRKIHFDFEEDQMILLGDVLDRGKEPLALWNYVMEHSNQMILLKGNHELFAQMYLEERLSENRWCAYGGEETIKQLTSKSKVEQARFLQQLRLLPIQKKIQTKYGATILTHSGIQDANLVRNEDGTINVVESIEKANQRDSFSYLISTDLHYMERNHKKCLDHYIICGHVPTMNLHASSDIYETEHYMCIDTGSYLPEFGGHLSAYCVETDEMFYL